MNNKLISFVTIFVLIFSSITFVFADINDNDINFFLEKIANTKNEDKKELGVFLLDAYLNKDNPDVEGLKKALELTATEEDIKKLEDNGVTLQEAIDSLDIFKEMNRDDIENLIDAVDKQDLSKMEDIVDKYTKDEKESVSVKPVSSTNSDNIVEEDTVQEEDLQVQKQQTLELIEIKFKDIDKHWAKDSIKFLAERAIIKGQSEESFNPNGNITRAEFTALIIRLLDLKEKEESEIHFKDVNKDDWFYSITKIANQYGIINGVDSEHFAPNAPVTREQMVSIIIRALNNIELNNSQILDIDIDKFDDKENISNWALKSVEKALKMGIINGRQANLFEPRGMASRAEAATIIKRIFDLINK